MKVVDDFLSQYNWSPQQVQDYIPLPMTMGAAMYCSGKAPDGTPIQVNRGLAERRPQRDMLRRKRDGEGDTLSEQRSHAGKKGYFNQRKVRKSDGNKKNPGQKKGRR